MGSRIQKIAGIIFALAFIGILATMNQQVLRFGTDVSNKVHNTTTVSVDYELEPFENTVVSGSTVISAIQNRNTLTSKSLSITVNGTNANAGDYLVFDDTSDPGVGNISPNSRYNSSFDVNDNGVVVGIIFNLQTT